MTTPEVSCNIPFVKRASGNSAPVRDVGETKALIADLLAKALTVREIAARLGISPQAVYKHMDQMRQERDA